MRAAIFVAVIGLVCGSAVAAPATHIKHEKRDFTEEMWEKRDRAHSAHILPVRIALKQRNLEHAERFIMEVSDPASPSYGKHWTTEEIADTFKPLQETTDKVVEWLHGAGIDKTRITHSRGRNWLDFDASIQEVENLLHTEYHNYEHTPTTELHVACDEYHVPREIQDHIDFVMPTIHLGGLMPLGKRSSGGVDSNLNHVAAATKMFPPMTGLTGLKNCNRLITIECLRAIYKFPALKKAQKGNEMGIAEWSDYLYLPDLKAFFYNFTKPLIPSTVEPEFISIDGGRRANLTVAKKQEVVESALDFQTSYSIIYPQKLRLYQMGDSINVNSVGTFNIFLDALDASYCKYKGGDSKKNDPHYPDPKKGGYKGPVQCGGAPISNVFSFSYLQTEAALPKFYQHRQCHEWMKLGLSGISMLFASGDSGVAMRYNVGFPNTCLAAHSNKQLVHGPRFNPGFPANCPYVTAVGATDLLTKSIHGGEKAVGVPNKTHPEEDFYSGGGFSNYFTLPAYQAKDVTHFLKTYSPKYGPNVFNQSGNARAYPDVSSLGLNLATVFLNNTYGIGGTSASAPTVASIVTLLNEHRLAAGKSPLGFLNPFFYANADAFNDVTVGGNPGCGTRGFRCQKGWDPVTGLGTPNFPKLLKAAMALG